MTQSINLYRYLPKKKKAILTTKVVIISYGAFIVFLFFVYLIQLHQKHKIITQFDQLNSEVSLLQQELTTMMQRYPVNNVPDLNKAILDLQKEREKKALMIDLLSKYTHFSHYLIGLGNAIVDGVWLTQISFNRGENNNIVLKGFTLQPVLLKQFFIQLRNQRVFSNIEFELNDINQSNYPASFIIFGKKKTSL